jgi:hypothetical protein
VPRNFDVEVEDGDFLLSWLAPLSDGGSPITEYFIEFKLSSDSAWDHWDSVSDSPTIANGLTPGESYDWRVAAVNANGQGPFTAPVTATFPGGGGDFLLLESSGDALLLESGDELLLESST